MPNSFVAQRSVFLIGRFLSSRFLSGRPALIRLILESQGAKAISLT